MGRKMHMWTCQCLWLPVMGHWVEVKVPRHEANSNRRPVGPQSNTPTTRPQWPPKSEYQIYPGSSTGEIFSLLRGSLASTAPPRVGHPHAGDGPQILGMARSQRFTSREFIIHINPYHVEKCWATLLKRNLAFGQYPQCNNAGPHKHWRHTKANVDRVTKWKTKQNNEEMPIIWAKIYFNTFQAVYSLFFLLDIFLKFLKFCRLKKRKLDPIIYNVTQIPVGVSSSSHIGIYTLLQSA